MSERLETLKKARERMIEDRDTKVLAAPFDRDSAFEHQRLVFAECCTIGISADWPITSRTRPVLIADMRWVMSPAKEIR